MKEGQYEQISELVESLTPYDGLMGDEYGELLSSLLNVAGHADYISNDEFVDILIKELSTIKTDLNENYEIVEESFTRTYKTLVEKYED